MTQENIDYFPIWHRSFINDINKSSIETANNGAIIKILWLNKDIRSLFPENVFLSNHQTKRTKPQTNNIFEEDDVLSDKRKNVLPFHYARGLCAPLLLLPPA